MLCSIIVSFLLKAVRFAAIDRSCRIFFAPNLKRRMTADRALGNSRFAVCDATCAACCALVAEDKRARDGAFLWPKRACGAPVPFAPTSERSPTAMRSSRERKIQRRAFRAASAHASRQALDDVVASLPTSGRR